ncbi:hypothetical protein VZT92_017697 [Zoarces viviparus]|uniref:Uncharacterized protein n=1 Tax=Zoarces viviparus TaxID=48416 RepID=A0AAW1ENS8_ZOAVI
MVWHDNRHCKIDYKSHDALGCCTQRKLKNPNPLPKLAKKRVWAANKVRRLKAEETLVTAVLNWAPSISCFTETLTHR